MRCLLALRCCRCRRSRFLCISGWRSQTCRWNLSKLQHRQFHAGLCPRPRSTSASCSPYFLQTLLILHLSSCSHSFLALDALARQRLATTKLPSAWNVRTLISVIETYKSSSIRLSSSHFYHSERGERPHSGVWRAPSSIAVCQQIPVTFISPFLQLLSGWSCCRGTSKSEKTRPSALLKSLREQYDDCRQELEVGYTKEVVEHVQH